MRSSGVCHQGVSPPSEGADRDRGLRRQGSGACREDLSLTATRETDVTQTYGRTCPRDKSRDIVTEMTSVMKTRGARPWTSASVCRPMPRWFPL